MPWMRLDGTANLILDVQLYRIGYPPPRFANGTHSICSSVMVENIPSSSPTGGRLTSRS